MKRIPHLFFLVIWITALMGLGRAQEISRSGESQTTNLTAKAQQPIPLPRDLVNFFSGEWTGIGEFANGKKIEAEVSFKPDLDNQWLDYRHTDSAPNKYKALGVWGYERSSSKFAMMVNDNFGGMRLFLSEGWAIGKIVFEKRCFHRR